MLEDAADAHYLSLFYRGGQRTGQTCAIDAVTSLVSHEEWGKRDLRLA
jgi:hypothetical protein